MAKPRQPADLEHEDFPKARLDDSVKHEVSSLELNDEDIEESDNLDEEDDMDY